MMFTVVEKLLKNTTADVADPPTVEKKAASIEIVQPVQQKA